MRRLLFGTLALCQLAVASHAAVTCASPQEMKALQAAALEQQLAAAAQSCHFTADYSLFVAKYRSAIVRSDHAVKAFFQSRKNSEGYDAYKTRIAQDASLRSLHEPQFCHNAKTVFDMALGRGGAGKSPAMAQTGYEHCKMPAAPHTVVVTTTTAAAQALALAETPPIPVPAHRAAHGLVPVPRPASLALRTAPVAKTAASAPPVTKPIVPHGTGAAIAIQRAASATALRQKEIEHPDIGQPRYATIEHRRSADRDASDGRRSDADGARGGIPNAYRPGSRWVGEELGDDDPPPSLQKRPPPKVMGPDGRWYVLIGHQDTWQRD